MKKGDLGSYRIPKDRETSAYPFFIRELGFFIRPCLAHRFFSVAFDVSFIYSFSEKVSRIQAQGIAVAECLLIN
jgi:hypothetical protein